MNKRKEKEYKKGTLLHWKGEVVNLMNKGKEKE